MSVGLSMVVEVVLVARGERVAKPRKQRVLLVVLMG